MTDTPGTKAGSVVLEFIADTSKLMKGYDQAEEVLDNYEKRAEESKTATRNLERQMESAGTTAQRSSTQMSRLSDATEDNADATKDAARIQVDLTDTLQQMGVSAKDAERIVDDLNDALKENADNAKDSDINIGNFRSKLDDIKVSGVGLATLITGIATAIIAVSTAAYKAASEVDDLNKNLAVTAGISLAEAQGKSHITESLVDKGYTRENVAPIVGQIVKLYPEWDDESMQKMAEKYAYFAETQGIATQSIVTDMQGVFDETKWNIQGPEEQAKVMETLYGAISKSTVSFEEFVSLLNEGDNAFRMMGMSAEEAIAYIASQDANLGDVAALINSIDMAIMQKSAELGSDAAAAAWIQQIVDATDGMEDATEIAKILKTELGVENERAAKAFAEALSAGSTEVSTLRDEIDAASTPLMELDEALRASNVALNRLKESVKDGLGFYTLGDEVEVLISQLDDLDRRGGLREIIEAGLRGELHLSGAKMVRDGLDTARETVYNITQNFLTPEVDTYAARRGTELALAADQSSQMHRI